MCLVKTVVKWILLFPRYVLVSLVVGNIVDEFLFHPLEAEIYRFVGSGEESGDQGGESDIGGLGGGGGGVDGARTSGGRV